MSRAPHVALESSSRRAALALACSPTTLAPGRATVVQRARGTQTRRGGAVEAAGVRRVLSGSRWTRRCWRTFSSAALLGRGGMAAARAPIDLSDLDPFAVSPAKAAPVPVAARARSPVVVHGPADPLSGFASTSAARRPSPAPTPSTTPLLPDFAPVPQSPPRGIRRPTRRLSSSSNVPTVAQTVGSAADFVAAFKASSPPASETLARIRRTSGNAGHARDAFQSGGDGAATRAAPERGASADGLAASFDTFMHAAKPVVSSIRDKFAGITFDDNPYATEPPAAPVSFSGAPGYAGQRIEASRRPTKAMSYDVDEASRPPIELHGVREGLRSSMDEDLAEAVRSAAW